MGSSDNFCLRWNDFETNISSSFRELRQDKEFFDVTLCCDNGSDRVGAHKVILAACSPFFRRILGGLNSQGPGGTSNHPLLYLKGIQKKELQAVLNFMYHGEVNVAQESLNAFLSCAEELAVKGLTTDSKPMATPSTSAKAPPAGADQDADFIQPSVKPSPASKKTPSRKRDLVLDDVDSEVPKKIKPEPETVEGADEDVDFVPDDYGGGAEGFDDSYGGGGGGGFDDMDDSAAMDGSETTKGMVKIQSVGIPANFLSSARQGTKSLEPIWTLCDPEGHMYSRNCGSRDLNRGTTNWLCKKYQLLKCKARATTKGRVITSLRGTHSHPVQEYDK